MRRALREDAAACAARDRRWGGPLRRHGTARRVCASGDELHPESSRGAPRPSIYSTEQPMPAYDEKGGLDFGATALMFSNRHFDPVAGSRLYNEYLEHYRLAEEVGFDGIMLNEH